MATIRRHPVPLDSYQPGRPLNDLMVAQLAHFAEAARRLPPDLRITAPVPPATDADAANAFIATVTERLMSLKQRQLETTRPKPTIVPKRPRKAPAAAPISLAAQAEPPEQSAQIPPQQSPTACAELTAAPTKSRRSRSSSAKSRRPRP